MTKYGKSRRWLPLMTAIVAPCLMLGCATPSSASSESKLPQNSGTGNEISGRGAIISGQGYAHTCQEGGVFLVPATNYWQSWADGTLGKNGPEYASPVAVRRLPDDKRAWDTAMHADCDSAGRFKFSGVAEGKYYVVADIRWLLRWQHNGSTLVRTVDVTGPGDRAVELVQDLRQVSRTEPRG